jgi:hypothetical protein
MGLKIIVRVLIGKRIKFNFSQKKGTYGEKIEI